VNLGPADSLPYNYGELMAVLAKADPTGALTAAWNPNTLPAGLRRLADHQRDDVRTGVAAHRDVAAASVWQLVDDQSSTVRLALATNGACTPQALEHLLTDRDPRVVNAAIANPATPMHAARTAATTRDRRAAVALARRSNLPLRDQLSVLETEFVAAHCALARNPDADPDVLEQLAKDHRAKGGDRKRIWKAVVSNPAAPLHVLVGIIEESPGNRVAQEALAHPRIPTDVLYAHARSRCGTCQAG